MTRACRYAIVLSAAVVLAGCSGDATRPQQSNTASAAADTTATTSSAAAHSVAPDWTVTPDPETASEVTAEDVALIEEFVVFMTEPTPQRARRLPFAADGVQLGLGDELTKAVTTDSLADEPSWTIQRETFRAYTGPFSPIPVIREHVEAAIDRPMRSTNDLHVSVGDHAHCASPPVPPPVSVESLRRVAVQPARDSIGTCVLWFSVDLYVDSSGDIRAVTLDRYEP